MEKYVNYRINNLGKEIAKEVLTTDLKRFFTATHLGSFSFALSYLRQKNYDYDYKTIKGFYNYISKHYNLEFEELLENFYNDFQF